MNTKPPNKQFQEIFSKGFSNFKKNLRALLQSLETLPDQELHDALLLVKRAVCLKYNNFDWQSGYQLDNSIILSQEASDTLILSPENTTITQESEEDNLQIGIRNCICQKATLEPCPVHCSTVYFGVSNIPYDNDTQNFKGDNYPETYLDLSQREKFSLESEKENTEQRLLYRDSQSDSEVILDLCSKSKENINDLEKYGKRYLIADEHLSYEVVTPPFHGKDEVLDDLELGIKFSSSALSLPGNSKLIKISHNEHMKIVANNNECTKSSAVTTVQFNPSVIQSPSRLKVNHYDNHKIKNSYSTVFKPYNTSVSAPGIDKSISEECVVLYADSKIENNNSSAVTESFQLSSESKNCIIPTTLADTLHAAGIFDDGSHALPLLNLKKTPYDSDGCQMQETFQSSYYESTRTCKHKPDKEIPFSLQLELKSKNDVALNLVNKKIKNKVDENILSSSDLLLQDKNSANMFDSQEISPARSVVSVVINSSLPETLSRNINLGGTSIATDAEKDSKKSPVSCKKCRALIPDESLWNEHRIQCSKFYCSICDINFNTKAAFQKHTSCHKRNSCKKCHKSFRRLKLLTAHMKEEHHLSSNLVFKFYTCEYCGYVLKKKVSLFHHLKIHALPNQHVCQKCGLFIEGESAYKSHLEEHIQNATLKCHLCDAIFVRRQQYEEHIKGHKKNGCKYCEKSFSSKKSLYYHCKNDHPALPQTVSLNKSYKCDKCPKTFIRPSLLRDHKITHSESNPFMCRECNIRFSQRSSLRKHLKSLLHKHTSLAVKLQNTGASDLKDGCTCEYCGIVYPSQYFLQKHSLQVHLTSPTLKCAFCDYKTKRKPFLKRHTDTHLGLEKRKFICEMCGSSFVSLTSLKEHSTFLHSDERCHKCVLCDKSFKNNSSLSRHKRTHSNERPYICECGACYKQLPHLVRHLSSAHSKKLKTRRIKRLTQEEIELAHSSSTSCSSVSLPGPAEEWSTLGEQEKVLERETSDFVLTPSGSVLINEDTGSADPTPLFTVLDSQFIQLIPSSLQLNHEGIQTVSLVTNDLHALSVGSSYDPSQGLAESDEPFSSDCGDSLIIQPSNSIAAQEAVNLNALPSNTSNEINSSSDRIDMSLPTISSSKLDDHKGCLQIPSIIEESSTLHFANSSLEALHYDTTESLQSSNFLTQQSSSLSHLSQEIVQNISLF